ncbi:MAG: class I SAM-dependent methyltransferase [bacterium]
MQADTFERSCAHWSDAGRDGMEAFYALARLDYRLLAEGYDWAPTLRARAAEQSALRLIDVACGSGKFPEALLAHAGLSPSGAPSAGDEAMTFDYDLLDPSPFSLREARQALAAPFRAGAEYCCTLQDWEPEVGGYDVAWATHALYCVPAEDLETAVERMARALAPEGFGFVAQGLREGHYVGFYDRYRESRLGRGATAYSDGGEVEEALRKVGLHVRSRELAYTTVVPAGEEELLERYLQRCVFDDDVSLMEMRSNEPLAGYLAACHDAATGEHRFPQRVATILFSPSERGLARAPRACDAREEECER